MYYYTKNDIFFFLSINALNLKSQVCIKWPNFFYSNVEEKKNEQNQIKARQRKKAYDKAEYRNTDGHGKKMLY